MSLVLTVDRRASRQEGGDRVAEAVAALNVRHGDRLALPFARTAGDEMQAVLAEGVGAGELLCELVETGRWHVGVGLGDVERLGADAPSSDGPAFWAAREAVEAAHGRSVRHGVAVRGEPVELARSLQAALAALGYIAAHRTEPQREVVRLRREGGTVTAIARTLGITQQAASQRLSNAGSVEEAGLVELVDRLLAGGGGR